MDFISRWITQFILFVGEQTQIFWNNLVLLEFTPGQIFLDILLVATIFYYILVLIKGTRAFHVMLGLIIIVLFFFVSHMLELVALTWLIDRFLTVALISIPIIFQRELRMALEKLGNTKLYNRQKARKIDRMILHIVDACTQMAKDQTGALIVLQNTIPLKEYVETGVPINADISKELLQSIFNKTSPLHDGAVIINREHIQAASCLLPHSYESNDRAMGTRHKAGLGLSESTDAAIIIVSEENGAISFARAGRLEKDISAGQLQKQLMHFMNPPKRKKSRRKK